MKKTHSQHFEVPNFMKDSFGIVYERNDHNKYKPQGSLVRRSYTYNDMIKMGCVEHIPNKYPKYFKRKSDGVMLYHLMANLYTFNIMVKGHRFTYEQIVKTNKYEEL